MPLLSEAWGFLRSPSCHFSDFCSISQSQMAFKPLPLYFLVNAVLVRGKAHIPRSCCSKGSSVHSTGRKCFSLSCPEQLLCSQKVKTFYL